MNKDQLYKLLSELLSEFHCSTEFLDELASILKNSGVEVKFIAVLFTRLNKLKEYGLTVINNCPRQFEKLKNTNDLYSMHINTGNLNVRILFVFIFDTPVLLAAFYERQGKKRTDYSAYIPIAESRRLKIIDRGLHNE